MLKRVREKEFYEERERVCFLKRNVCHLAFQCFGELDFGFFAELFLYILNFFRQFEKCTHFRVF